METDTHADASPEDKQSPTSLPSLPRIPRKPAPFPLAPLPEWARPEAIDKMLRSISRPSQSNKGKKRATPLSPSPTPPPVSERQPDFVSSPDFSIQESHPLYPTPSLSSRSGSLNSGRSYRKPSLPGESDVPGSSTRIWTLEDDGIAPIAGPISRRGRAELFKSETEPFRRRATLSILPEDSPTLPFELVYITPKGFGLRARKTFAQGDIIISETPFFEISTDRKHLDRNFALSEDPTTAHLRILFLSFTATIPDIDDIYLNILETNCLTCAVNVDDDGNEDSQEDSQRRPVMLGLFRYISRLSHSCRPNSGWRWDDSSGRYVLRAFCDIAPGREITASYLTRKMLTASRADRMRHLKTEFGFRCACPECACSESDEDPTDEVVYRTERQGGLAQWQHEMQRRENLRRRYRELEEEWEPALHGPEHLNHFVAYDPKTALAQVEESLQILEQLGLFACRQDPLSVRFAIHAGCEDLKAAEAAADAVAQFILLRDGMAAASQDEHSGWRTNPARSKFWGACISPNDGLEDGYSDYEDEERKAEDEEDARENRQTSIKRRRITRRSCGKPN